MNLLTAKRIAVIAIAPIIGALTAIAQVAGQPIQSVIVEDHQQVVVATSALPAHSNLSLASGYTTSAALAAPESAMLPMASLPITKPATRSEVSPSARQRQIWRGLVFAQHSAAIFDAWSTRESLQSGNGYERNPLMRPFANSAAIYPMLQIAPVGLDFLSHRMMRSQNRFFRKTWWLPQAASVTASIWCGSRNIRVANLRHY